MLADERLYLEGEGQGREVEEEVSDHNFHRIKSWLDTLVHQSIESHDTKSNSQQQYKILADTDTSLKMSMSSLVDKSISNPPKIPPRRKNSKVENPIESDYENILKLETNNQTEYFNNSTSTNGTLDNEKRDKAESIHKVVQVNTDNSEASDKVKFETHKESTIRLEELANTPPVNKPKTTDEIDSLDELSEMKIKEGLSLNNNVEKYPTKQIIVEKLIVNGKVQEIRKYILNNDQAENFLEQNNEDLQIVYPESVIADRVNNENQTLKHNVNATENTPISASLTQELNTVINEEVHILKTDDKSNSTSYESLCYSEKSEEDNDEPNLNIPNKEIITSAKLLVVMDPDVLKSIREKSVSPILASDHNEKSLQNSSSEIESQGNSNSRDESRPTLKKPTVRVSNTSNVTIHRNIPQDKKVFQEKENEIQSKHTSVHNEIASKTVVDRITEQPNPSSDLELEESSETNETNKNTVSLPSLELQEEFVKTFMGVNQISIPIVRAASISPSATEIIAGSTQGSRDASLDLEQFDEFREESEGDVSSDEYAVEDNIETILTKKTFSEITYLSSTDQILPTHHFEESANSYFPEGNNTLLQEKRVEENLSPENLVVDLTNVSINKSKHHFANTAQINQTNVKSIDEKNTNTVKDFKEKGKLKNEHTSSSTEYIIQDKRSLTTDLIKTNTLNTITLPENNILIKSETKTEKLNGMDSKDVKLNSSEEIKNIPEESSNKCKEVLNEEYASIDTKSIPDEALSFNQNHINNELPTIFVNKVDSFDQISTKNISDSDTFIKLDDNSKSSDIAQESLVGSSNSNISQSPNKTPSSLNISENASSEENISSSRELSPIIGNMIFDKEEEQNNETGSLEYNPQYESKINAESESQDASLRTNSNSNISSGNMSRSSERVKAGSQQSTSTHVSTPASMPEYVINEALNSTSNEDDNRSSLGSKSTRGSSDKSQASDRSLSMIESRAEILELLKESLSSDHVLDRIVSTLFASVLNHNDSIETGKPSDSEELHPDNDIHHFQTFSSSDSEIKTESDFYEAQEDVENEDVRGDINVNIGDEKEAEEPDQFLNKEFIVVNGNTNDSLNAEELKVNDYEVS